MGTYSYRAEQQKWDLHKHIWGSALRLDQTCTFFHVIISENFLKAYEGREGVGESRSAFFMWKFITTVRLKVNTVLKPSSPLSRSLFQFP